MAFTTQQQQNPFIGKWIGESKGDVGSMAFDVEGYATIELDGQEMGGKEFEVDGVRSQLGYEFNDSVQPIELNFLLRNLETEEEKKMRLIARFISHDSLELASNFNETRPTEFTEENSIILTRVESPSSSKEK
ncbi:MAG: hypothetical protein KJP21_02890 [Bacteroidia bacterium]|nr:hypothetical protein [Bacteroidia bacterium]